MTSPLLAFPKTPRGSLSDEEFQEQVVALDRRCMNRRCPSNMYGRPDLRYLRAHHIRYTSDGGPNETWNGVTLCFDCHRTAHKEGRSWMVDVLSTWLFTKAWRWGEVYDELRRKAGEEAP